MKSETSPLTLLDLDNLPVSRLKGVGVKKEEAIQLVRSRRKGAIETKEQEEFIFSYRPVA